MFGRHFVMPFGATKYYVLTLVYYFFIKISNWGESAGWRVNMGFLYDLSAWFSCMVCEYGLGIS